MRMYIYILLAAFPFPEVVAISCLAGRTFMPAQVHVAMSLSNSCIT